MAELQYDDDKFIKTKCQEQSMHRIFFLFFENKLYQNFFLFFNFFSKYQDDKTPSIFFSLHSILHFYNFNFSMICALLVNRICGIVSGMLAAACQSQLCTSLPNSMFSDIILGLDIGHSGSIFNIEIVKSLKSRLLTFYQRTFSSIPLNNKLLQTYKWTIIS